MQKVLEEIEEIKTACSKAGSVQAKRKIIKNKLSSVTSKLETLENIPEKSLCKKIFYKISLVKIKFLFKKL